MGSSRTVAAVAPLQNGSVALTREKHSFFLHNRHILNLCWKHANVHNHNHNKYININIYIYILIYSLKPMNGHLEPHDSACSCRNFRSSPVMLLDICSCVLELATKSSSSAHLRAVAWQGENWEWVPWKLPWWEKFYIYIYIYTFINSYISFIYI